MGSYRRLCKPKLPTAVWLCLWIASWLGAVLLLAACHGGDLTAPKAESARRAPLPAPSEPGEQADSPANATQSPPATTQPTNTPVAEEPAQAPAAEHISEQDDADSEDPVLMGYVRDFVSATPYSAVIKYTGLKVVPLDEREEKHILQARVLKTLRGRPRKRISYYLIAERGEPTKLSDKPVIITLCADGDTFYWPGVGAELPWNPRTEAVAMEASRAAPADQQVFGDCGP